MSYVGDKLTTKEAKFRAACNRDVAAGRGLDWEQIKEYLRVELKSMAFNYNNYGPSTGRSGKMYGYEFILKAMEGYDQGKEAGRPTIIIEEI